MDILLIRHGQAVDEAPGLGDGGRWLTAKGRKITRRVGRWLAKNNRRRPAAVWTSPLVRAVQTAEIFAAKARVKGEVRAIPQLAPGHDPGDLLKLLAETTVEGPLALVGHEPSLSLIANALLGDTGFTGFKKGGVMGISLVPPPPAEDGASAKLGDTPNPPAGKITGELWFVLDPARMKAQKRIVPQPAPPPPEPPPPAADQA